MTCIDCIHWGICQQDYIPGCFPAIYMGDRDDVEKFCRDFKDKSKFIELTCFVGDYVWIIGRPYDDSPYEIAMSKVYKIQLKKDKTLLFTFSWNFEHGLRHSGNFSINTLGKKWFLTREEAEKKLEELNGKV